MKFTSKQYAIALHHALFESKPDDQEKILDNFAQVLKQNGDIGRMDEIEQEFFTYEKEAKGIKMADVTSAHELSTNQEQEIIKELNEHIGGQVELRKKIDEGLIGGVVIRVGDELIDGSVKKNLKDLKSKLVM